MKSIIISTRLIKMPKKIGEQLINNHTIVEFKKVAHQYEFSSEGISYLAVAIAHCNGVNYIILQQYNKSKLISIGYLDEEPNKDVKLKLERILNEKFF